MAMKNHQIIFMILSIRCLDAKRDIDRTKLVYLRRLIRLKGE